MHQPAYSKMLSYLNKRKRVVIAHSGSICRIQFLRRELGVEPVRDVDVMPANPIEYMPDKILETYPHVSS